MFYKNEYLATLVKKFNKDKIILIYCYIVTVLIIIIIILSLHIFFGYPFSYDNSSLYTNIDTLSQGINNLDNSHTSITDRNVSSNLYIRFAKFLINSDKVYTISRIPGPSYFKYDSSSHLHNNTLIENNQITGQSTILKVLDLKLKLKEECKLKLEKDYRLKLKEYDLELVK